MKLEIAVYVSRTMGTEMIPFSFHNYTQPLQERFHRCLLKQHLTSQVYQQHLLQSASIPQTEKTRAS